MNEERLLSVILSPQISEKATVISEKHNQYVFKVMACATKKEIKDAVEHLFSTKVESVRVLNVKPKKKVFKGTQGKRKGWKKAYVALASDQKLEIASE